MEFINQMLLLMGISFHAANKLHESKTTGLQFRCSLGKKQAIIQKG